MCSLPSLFLTGAPASRQKRHDFLMLAFKLSKNSRKLPSLFSPTFLSFAGAKVLHFPLPPTTFFIIFQTFSIRAECQQDRFIRTRRIGREKDASGGKTEAETASGKPNGGPGGAPETAPERAGNGRAKAVTGKRQGETGTGRTGTENIPIPFTWHSLYICYGHTETMEPSDGKHTGWVRHMTMLTPYYHLSLHENTTPAKTPDTLELLTASLNSHRPNLH